jgi:hypothetical protein
MHMSAMLKLFGLNCDILFIFTKVLFTAVILPNFCY